MEKKDIVVVIPVYRITLSDDEHLSLAQCVAVLSDYQIAIIKPESLDINIITSKYAQLKVESFPDECFAGLRGYNKLVLSDAFYHRFARYQYMLIYQLDAYVFKDELLFWAEKGYDYIGAPWIPPKHSHLTITGRIKLVAIYTLFTIFNDERRKLKKYCNYQVGNGGFSLRKVSKMIEITRFYKCKIDEYMSDDKPFYPEDVFLLLELNSRNYHLKKPKFKEALKFSIEENPLWGYNYNHNVLPFGCHDWNHESYASFWLPIIKNSSLNIKQDIK